MPDGAPLAASAEIAYTKLQKGPVTAEALLGRPAAEVRRELDETGRTVQFPVTVQMRDEAGDDTSHMTISWALLPHR